MEKFLRIKEKKRILSKVTSKNTKKCQHQYSSSFISATSTVWLFCHMPEGQKWKTKSELTFVNKNKMWLTEKSEEILNNTNE